ncbi:PHD finger protein EHD3-like isoform X4 [Mangifera indica]|uniref:PHD finger protein EHD3-like isoform X4 n=1 Tax=Mangifera indica TaxID=29780 RepID=UPI001CFB772B|nr:PHD finger protein EHD3-like isoform X4 [Mangifera indica]
MMGCEEGTSNGDTEWLKRGRGINGIEVGRVQDFGGGRSVASEGFRTYKRRKHVRSTEEAKFLEDSFRIQRKNRNAVLIQMLGSFKGVGGIEECIREAFFFDPEIVCSTIKVWGKLQEIGAEMISLANSVAEFSRTSCSEHVGGPIKYDEEKNEQLFSGETNFDAKMVQPEAGGVNKVCTCRCCEEKADGKDCLVCDSCEEMYHVSCIEPAVQEIPLKNWYCGSCTAKGIGSPHENCVVCETLNAPTNQGILVGDGTSPAYETFIEFEGKSNSNTDEVQESEEKRYLMYPCGICGVRVASCDEFQYCDHDYCPYKLYHNRCLTPKQSKSYGSRWLCPSCLCRGCFTDKDDDKIVLCEACDHAYHIYCMEPPRSSIPKHRWFCRKCEAGLKEIRRVKEVYENEKKKKGDKNIKAYENGQKKKSKEDISHENLEKNLNGKSEEESDGGRGGMDMLLNAAKTLNFEEFGRKEEFKLKRG